MVSGRPSDPVTDTFSLLLNLSSDGNERSRFFSVLENCKQTNDSLIYFQLWLGIKTCDDVYPGLDLLEIGGMGM